MKNIQALYFHSHSIFIPMIDSTRIDRIKNTPLLDVIGKYVYMEKKGRDYFGLCPFHEETTPSFSISPKKGVWKCFGCGEAGTDSISFIEKKENLSFPQAVEHIEKEMGWFGNSHIITHMTPPKKNTKKKEINPPEQKEYSTFPTQNVDAQLAFNEQNPFHLFLKETFPDTYQNIILKHHIGTSGKYYFDNNIPKTVFWYRNEKGEYLNGKIVPYSPDGKRKKDKTNIDYAPRWGGVEEKGYIKCLFGQHQILNAPIEAYIGLVESEKTVIVASQFAPRIIWLAKGASTGLTDEKIWVLKDRHVLVFPDCDTAGRKMAASDLEKLTGFAASVSVLDIFPERDDKTDICDHFLAGEIVEDDIFEALLPKEEPTPPNSHIDDKQRLKNIAFEWVLIERDIYEALSPPNIDLIKSMCPLLTEKEIKAIVEDVYAEHKGQKGDKKIDPFFAAQKYLANTFDFRENTINDSQLCRRKNEQKWIPVDDNAIYTEVKNHHIKISKADISALIHRRDNFSPYDPIEEYFNSLPEWDGQDHISNIAQMVRITPKTYKTESGHAITAQAFFSIMLRKHLIRHLVCSLGGENAIPNRYILNFSSPKEKIGKTRFIRKLCPKVLKEYYTEEPIQKDKDSSKRLTSCFMYNLEEYDPNGGVSLSHFKYMISVESTNQRDPFSKESVWRRRICNFWSTNNESQFLQDSVNSRWLTFEVDGFEAKIWDYPIEQIWAQTLALYKSGAEWDLDQNESFIQASASREFEETDVYTDLILSNFVICKKGDGEFNTPTDIVIWLNKNVSNTIRIHSNQIGKRLRKLGFYRDKPGKQYGYWIKYRGQLSQDNTSYELEMYEKNQVGF
jgi:Domain of unknown function (DUF6371)/CHC2 zinc finger/Virulence-associated protein E